MASRALLGPHFVDTRLVHLTSASETLSDLPTHGKATWGTTEVRALRLEWVARSAAALPESSSGGDQSLSPPNITARRAGFCVSCWVVCVPSALFQFLISTF